MQLSRRDFVIGSTTLLTGCAGGQNSAAPQSTTTTTSTTTASSTECRPQPYVDSPTKRAEYAIGLYQDAYDVLQTAQQDIGVIIDQDGLIAHKEEGADANYPDGLILERREGGDVLITLALRTTDQSALYDMRHSRFYDAIEQLRSVQEFLTNRIDGTEQFTPPWQEIEQFLEACEVKNGDLFVTPVANGLEATKHLRTAAMKFEAECKAYLDQDAEFEDEVPEADELQDQGVAALKQAAGAYPRTPESLENKVLVYRSE
jgi:hypothetical protein